MLGNIMKVLRILANTFHKYTLRAFYRTFSNFVSTVTRLDYRDFVGNVQNTFETVYRNYEVFSRILQMCPSS